nr:NSP5 [Bat RVJ-like rotavirus BtSY2]
MGEEIRFNLKTRKNCKLSKKISVPLSEESSTVCVEEDVKSIASDSQSSEHSYTQYAAAYHAFTKEIPENTLSNDSNSILSDESMDTEPVSSKHKKRENQTRNKSPQSIQDCDTPDGQININASFSKKSHPNNDPDAQHKYEIAQLTLRVEKLEVDNRNKTLDSCFNILMANLENLNPSQRKSLLFGLLAMMK